MHEADHARMTRFTADTRTSHLIGGNMPDEMINKTSPMPGKGVDGIGDTQSIHYKEWDMNMMNNPVEIVNSKGGAYSKGQSKKGQ